MDISNMCRGCMKEVASWETDIFDQRAVDMFCFCTQIEVSKDDRLPKQLCKCCSNNLEKSYTFIKQAQNSNITLLAFISQTSVIIKPGHYQKLQKIAEINKNINNKSIENYTEAIDNLNDTDSQCPFDNSKTIQSIEQNKVNEIKYAEITENEIKPNIYVTDKNLSKDEETKNYYNNNEEKKVKSCPVCRKTFVSTLWYTRHMEKEHSDTKQFVCDQCNKSFPTSRRLLCHRDSHTRQRQFPCDSCAKSFYKRKQLAAHARSHRDDRPYACHLCHMTFKIKSILTSHLKVHENDKPFLCSICGRGFRTASHLECHSRLHTGVKPYSCGQCPFRARFTASLRRHELRHKADKRHVCPRCQKGFYESGALARHMRTHTGERPFQCPSCARAFTDGSKRKVHMMRVHQLALEDIPLMHRDGRPVEQ